MFGFIKRYFADRRLSGLKAQLQKTPRPDLFLQLVKAYQEQGKMDAAAATAKRGAARFPDFPALVKVRDEIEVGERQREIARLHQRIESYPNQILFGRLADLYRASNMLDEATQVCEAGIAAFPTYGGTYLILGQICLEREDPEGALKHIEKATELDPYNYMALKLLAQVHMQMDQPKEASQRLLEILQFAPGDESITQLLIDAKRAAGESVADLESALASPAAKPAAPPAGTGRRRMLSRDRQARARGKVLGEAIAQFRGVEGVSGAILVDNFGLVIASDIAMDVEEELAGAMITNIFRTTSQSAQDMGIGDFSEGLIEGESGHIHVVGIGETVLAVFASPTTRAGMLHQAIKDFTSKAQSVQ